MRREGQQPRMRLSRRHERWLYAIGALIFLSGLGWLADHYVFAGLGDFGDAHAPSEPLWLRLHGAAAMAGLVVVGSLLPGHIARAWRLRVNRRSGLLMLSLVVLLVVTGYGLYYVGDEETRPWISVVHWLVGIVSGVGLVLHVRLGKGPMGRLILIRALSNDSGSDSNRVVRACMDSDDHKSNGLARNDPGHVSAAPADASAVTRERGGRTQAEHDRISSAGSRSMS